MPQSSERGAAMSDLIIIGYDDPQTARQAYEQVLALRESVLVEPRGLAIVTVDADGKTHVDTPDRTVANSAAGGAVFGLLFGVLFLVPGLGILGGAIGALFGLLARSGISEAKLTAALTPFGGTVLKTSLSDSAERELADAMAGTTE